jgi:hypothetical protein
MSYIDFDITLTETGDKVLATLDCRDHAGVVSVSLGKCTSITLCDFLKSTNPDKFMNKPELVSYGADLFKKIFVSQLSKAFGQVQGINATLVRIGIEAGGGTLKPKHWELLCEEPDNPRFFSTIKGFSIARIINLNGTPRHPNLAQGIRVLVGHASPLGHQAITSTPIEELKSIIECGGHTCKPVDQMSYDSIRHGCGTLPEGTFDVIHLICHGTKKNDGESGTLFFEDGNRRTKKIQSDVLTHALVSRTPSLVVLQACQSAEVDSSTDLVLGVAETLLRAGIPSVLAFRGKPKIDMAYVFMKCLYEHWLVNFDSFEKALTEARMAVQLYTDGAKDKRSVDEWSFPVFYRHSGVNLQIRRGTPPLPDRLAALLEAIAIALKAQKEVLIAIHDYLKREGLIEATSSDSNKPDPERVAMLLLAPISDNPGIPTTARFLAVLTDWKKRKLTFSEKGQKESLRLIRDTVFLASFPEDDTQEMIDAISNAIQEKLPEKGSAATTKSADKLIAEKLGRFAHGLLMEQRSGKKGTQSFLYQLLNKKIEDDDTSIFFEDRFYEYAFINEPELYLKKQSTKKRIEEFAKGCMDQLRKGAESTSWKRTLESYLETEHRRRRLIFVRISRPQNPKDIKNLEEIMNAFPRMVFIQMNAQGNAPVYVDIMAHIAQIDLLLTELFQKKS